MLVSGRCARIGGLARFWSEFDTASQRRVLAAYDNSQMPTTTSSLTVLVSPDLPLRMVRRRATSINVRWYQVGYVALSQQWSLLHRMNLEDWAPRRQHGRNCASPKYDICPVPSLTSRIQLSTSGRIPSSQPQRRYRPIRERLSSDERFLEIDMLGYGMTTSGRRCQDANYDLITDYLELSDCAPRTCSIDIRAWM